MLVSILLSVIVYSIVLYFTVLYHIPMCTRYYIDNTDPILIPIIEEAEKSPLSSLAPARLAAEFASCP